MKIAICFKGMFDSGSKGGKTGNDYNGIPVVNTDYSLIAYHFYKHNILSQNSNIDIFCHNWGTEYTDKIKTLYNPIKIVSENKNEVEDLNDKKSGIKMSNRVSAIISNWYSIMRSVDLMREYEIEKNIKYDVVLIARYDVGILKPLNFSEEHYDFKNIMYHSGPDPIHGIGCRCGRCDPNHPQYEIPDLLFFSNSDNIYNLSRVFLKNSCKSFINDNSNHITGAKMVRSLKLNRNCVTHTKKVVFDSSIWQSIEQGGDITVVRWMKVEDRNNFIKQMLGLDIKQIIEK